MTTDRSVTWTQKFKKHFADNVARLGGKYITPQRRTIAREAAVLQVEHDRMAQRFASGNGASREDLLLYTQISSTVQRLFESAGIIDVAVKDDGRLLASAMVDSLSRVIAARQVGGASVGVTIDGERVRERVIDHDPAEPNREPAPPLINKVPHDNVRIDNTADEPPPPLRSTPRLVTPPEQAKARAMQPQPQPIRNAERHVTNVPNDNAKPPAPQPPGELNTTEKFLLWDGAGGWGRRGSDWGPCLMEAAAVIEVEVKARSDLKKWRQHLLGYGLDSQ